MLAARRSSRLHRAAWLALALLAAGCGTRILVIGDERGEANAGPIANGDATTEAPNATNDHGDAAIPQDAGTPQTSDEAGGPHDADGAAPWGMVTSGKFTKFELLPSVSARSITVGPDGNLWFAAVNGVVGNIPPNATSASMITRFQIPGVQAMFDGGGPISASGIVTGADGNLWVAPPSPWVHSANNIIKVPPNATSSGMCTLLQVINANPYAITTGPDGNIWFTEQSQPKIAKVSPSATHWSDVTEFSLPGSAAPGIAVGPDGNIWFTEAFDYSSTNKPGRIAKIPPHAASSSDISELAFDANPYLVAAEPEQIVAGPDGNIWFTVPNVKMIGMVPPGGTSADIALFGIPDVPSAIAVGPDASLWFTARTPTGAGNKIGKLLLPATSGPMEWDIPWGVNCQGLVTGPDRNIWIVCDGAIVRVTP